MSLFKKLSSGNDPQLKPSSSFKNPKTTLIQLAHMKEFLERETKNNYKTLRNWYEKMDDESKKEAKESNKSALCGTIIGNVNKNRFKNLLPYDYNRVILGRTWDDFKSQQMVDPSYHSATGNYINASYIGVCNTNMDGQVLNQESIADPKFIVTQDPLDNTIGDFWRMVYEQRSPMIINLTGAVDENECNCYWPPEVGKKAVYSTGGSRIWVQHVYQSQKPVWIERNFKIWPEGYDDLYLFVRHMQYMGWSINYPPAASNLLKFIDDVANPAIVISATAGPLIVQCRGGIGRNGFFIASWLLKQNIELGMQGVDIYNMIKHLRRYRVGFVNSVEYFVELHKFALKIIDQIKVGGFKKVEYMKY